MASARQITSLRSSRALPAVLLAAAAAALLAGAGPARAQNRAHLPLALRSAAAPAGPTARPPATPVAPLAWSTVLADTPVFPGMGLTFYELRPAGDPPAAVALYDPPAAIPGRDEVTDWYRTVLPTGGWRLATGRATGGRWTRAGGSWLEVQYDVGDDGVLRLALRRDPDGARAVDGRGLQLDLPVPRGAVRLRYDPADLLPEELGLDLTAAEARLAMERTLTRSGWRETKVLAAEAAMLLRFERSGTSVLVSVRSLAAEASEIGLGEADCEPAPVTAPGGSAAGRAVYLLDVSVPPDMGLVGYERDPGPGTAAERWRGTCADLDLVVAGYLGRLMGAGWQLPAGGLDRRPAGADLRLDLAAGPPLAVEVRPLADRVTEVVARRAEAARRLPAARASLLWPDTPLPPGADAWQLTTATTDGWHWRERYLVPPALAGSLFTWYRREMMETAWKLHRLEPVDSGPGLVYFRDGEELWVEPGPGPAAEISLARRRPCAGADPVAPPALGRPARWLDEMLVYPAAELEGFEAPAERYRTRCAETGLIADWYRTMLERGNWALVSTLHPNDPDRRLLTFARPWERTWPPEQRTAWAEVAIERPWPYHHRIVLRRDPTGIVPGPGTR